MFANEKTFLTRREKQICFLFLSGFNVKDIAKILFLVEGTIKKHKSNIRKKLNANNDVLLGFELAKLFSPIEVKEFHIKQFNSLGKEN